MAEWVDYVDRVPEPLWLAALVLLLGLVGAYLVAKVNRRLLVRAGVPEAIEETAFERTARSFGTSTVDIVAKLSMYFLVGLTLLVALTVADIRVTQRFWSGVVGFVPQLFVATLVLIVGVLVGDKVELAVGERLRGVKLPEVGFIPGLAKYSVIYISVLVALGQVGVATAALLILLAVYVFGLVFLGGLALKDVLSSAAAGVYLLLHQPYGIGDEIRVGDYEGIVQEVDVFTTHVESDEAEYIVPNSRVFSEGVVRRR
jgi:small-conductance mechanosensitive channel